MTDLPARRRRALAALIRTAPIASQEEAIDWLDQLGFSATQATVSRDLDQLGAVKVKQDGMLRYALPAQIAKSDWAGSRLDQIIAEWVVSAEAAANMLVLKTPPGSAHLVGLAVDQARLPEIAGTVCGDDTLFLVVRDGFAAEAAMARFAPRPAGADGEEHRATH